MHVFETGSKAERMLALAEVEPDPKLWNRVRPLVPKLFDNRETEVRIEVGETLLELGQLSGVPPIFQVLKSGEAAEARKDAWEHLKAHVPLPPELGPTDLGALEHWWSENEKRLVPGGAGVFKLAP